MRPCWEPQKPRATPLLPRIRLVPPRLRALSCLQVPHNKHKVVVVADAGFGCVAIVAKMSTKSIKYTIACICSIKTAHSRLPKETINEMMRDALTAAGSSSRARSTGRW